MGGDARRHDGELLPEQPRDLPRPQAARRRLGARARGAALARGLLLFYAVCGIGAAANVGVATLLLNDGVLAWGAAGVAGALITVVWNYAVSSTLVWPAPR